MKALYFAEDGRNIIVGESHTVECTPKVCEVGLHGSIMAIDALKYASGCMLYLVEISGDTDKSDDKICGTKRKYLSGVDLTSVLRKFAKNQALINIDKIKQYCSESDFNTVYDWLIYDGAAESAVRSAVRSAEWSAAESAAVRSAANNTLIDMIEKETGWDLSFSRSKIK